VNVSADPSASIWEVTRMILDSPGTSPSVIAHAHGFSAVEVADLLPIFLDNLRTDFSSADGPAPALVPPTQQPGETPEEHADRYLRELAENEHLDVVGYDTLGATDGDVGGDLDGGDLDDDLAGDLDGDLGQDPTFLDAPPAETAPDEIVELDDGVDGSAAAEQPDPELPEADPVDPVHDLAEDDPFAASSPSSDDGTPEHDVPAATDDSGEPFAMS
jgi:hypothetical protein